MNQQELVGRAIEARQQAYAPYSGFMVGAALLDEEGRVYLGCNIENAAYSPSLCAERCAFAQAICGGARSFQAIAIAGWPQAGPPGFAYPCGVCRQMMAEFCHPESFRIIVAAGPQEWREYTLAQLLPHGFGPENLS